MSYKHELMENKVKKLCASTINSQGMLKFITCGSVDDGKSTLIGRLLYDSNLIYEDQLKSLALDSKRSGSAIGGLDLSLLVDGLEDERAQGITIDVAYRFFSTSKRKFIVADTPGHEQYTRNMVTAASNTDVAIVILDVKKGILTQTCRHSVIVSMLGIKNIILAINKMDLVNYDNHLFQRIEEDYRLFAKKLHIETIQCIPISALYGDNIVRRSEHTSWYTGPCLLEYLETILVHQQIETRFFLMPVQWVNRANPNFRGFCGTISSGLVSVGDTVKVLPSKQSSKILKISTYDGDLEKAFKGQPVTLLLEDEISISRGDVIVSEEFKCTIGSQFRTNILWMSEKAMVSSRQYILQSHTSSARCTISKPKHRIDVNTLEFIKTSTLSLNEFGVCDIALNKSIVMQPYDSNREMGAFILIDRITNETVAAGMIMHELRRSKNVLAQPLTVNKVMRSSIKGHMPCVIWLTGISGSGKSTIANLLEIKFYEMGKHTILLDGDNIRLGLNKDLGFTEEDRAENIRRIAEVSKLMIEAGLITIVSFISPFRAEREMARKLIGRNQFIEVFADASLEAAEARDVKGLYKKARSGEIPNFTGIGSLYEVPEKPDIHLDTVNYTPQESAASIINFLYFRKVL